MFKRSVYLMGLALLLGSSGLAEDKTPYPFVAGGNTYATPGGVPGWNTSTPYGHWLSDRFDMILNGTTSFLTNVRANDSSLPIIWVGPYASSQEINLYQGGNPTMSYNDRLKDIANRWLYIYAKSYVEDTLSMSVESLVVHIADNAVTIVQSGDGSRTVSGLQSLPLRKRRFTYQYWNNTSSDTAFYPMGYTWLANGYCPEARAAIASAYYRAFVTNPAAQGWPTREWDCYFMDNHARRLSFMAYWSLTSSSGGENNSYLEWLENDTMLVRQNGAGNDMTAQLNYFDNSTVKIDSAIQSRLRSGGHDIKAFANVYSTWPDDLPLLLPHVAGVVFETGIDYTSLWGNWKLKLASYDTLRHYPNNYSVLEYRGDFLCQDTGWLSDTGRVMMAGYAFFLIARTPTTFFGPHSIHQGDFGGNRRCWQDVFYVDLGEADSTWRKLDSTGTGDWGTKTMILYRSYGNDAVIFRSSYSSADFNNDSEAVNLHGLFREIDARTGDTSLAADSIFYLRPYEGKALVAGNMTVCDYPPAVPVLSSPTSGSSVSVSPTLCAANAGHGGCADPVTYQFEIADDPQFSAVVRQSGWLTEGSGTTCYTTSAPIPEGRRYYWRCRATNGTATSGWSSAYNFTTPNTAPPAPTANSPEHQGTVNVLRPTLIVNNVADPQGTPVVYFFQVSKFANFSSLAAQAGPLPQGSPTTSWQVTPSLENGTAYFWRARAYDNIAYSGWMTTRSFTVNVPVVNQPPSTPAVYSPPDGATITFVPISLTWHNATDPDGQGLTYHVQLMDSASAVALDSALGVAQSGGATTSYSPQLSLINARWYSWRVRAFDGIDYSPWMTAARFYLDTMYGVNQPPQVPGLVSPADNDTMISLQVSLAAHQAFDPESDPLTYEFALYTDQDLTNKIDSADSLSPSGMGEVITWPVSTLLTSGRRYFWSCRAYDGDDHSSWAAAFNFWAFDFSVNADQTSPTNLYPINGEVVKNTRPRLEVDNVISVVDENLYYFEVSEDSTFINRVYSGPVEEEAPRTTGWEVSVPLKSNHTYWWRSRANNSPYSELSSFRIDAEIFIAPNPYRPSEGPQNVAIYNMSPEGTLTITTIANEVVRILDGNSGGAVAWDVTNSNGKNLASDVYLCYYKDHDRVDKFKFVVIR